MTFLQLTGQEAIDVGLASNRQPEVNEGDHWRGAMSRSDANQYLRIDPQLVRLNGFPRPLIEAITGRGLDVDANLLSVVTLLLSDTSLDEVRRKALEVIKGKLS